MENLDPEQIKFLAERAGLDKQPNKRETCPDCDSEITDKNELIDPERYNTQHGSCLDCYDPTPYYPNLGF